MSVQFYAVRAANIDGQRRSSLTRVSGSGVSVSGRDDDRTNHAMFRFLFLY